MPRNRKGLEEAQAEGPQAGQAAEGSAAVETAAAAPEGDAPADDRVAALEAEVAEMKDRYLRAVADMDNVRRRSRMEAEDARKFANETLMSALLPVLDNFTRALEAAEQTTSFDALKGGVDQTRRQMLDILSNAGLERIEAVGQPFDPNLHEAIMQVPAGEGQAPNQVAEELRAGYKLNDRVLRPTLVKVTAA